MSLTLALACERLTQRAQRVTGSLSADWLCVATIGACAVILHRDGLFGDHAFYELDTRLFYYPLAAWVGEQLQAGVYPLWLPSIFTGYPIFADGELGLAYLPQVALLTLLPAALAMVWLRVLHSFLAGLFAYLYLRTIRLAPLPALGGALVFAFGSFLTVQMHHENIVRSAVWLPAVLACLERALFRVPRSVVVWTALGALAFAQSALGLHVQPVMMSTLALAAYALFRAFVPSANTPGATRNAYVPLLASSGIVVGGFALAAAQWLPLAEWALSSSRRAGVDYVFGSAFNVAPQSLATLLFPFFFRLPDATTWWTLWQQWEVDVYVGIPTLALTVVGLAFARRRELLFFVPLAALSLLVAMAQDAPFFNLHQLLWSAPGFSFLRAPGRFTYLFVFACACLAACGLQALSQRRLRALVALAGGVPTVALLAALLALLPSWRAFLLADPSRARGLAESTYLSARAQYPIDPQLVVDGLLSSLDFGNPKTTWSLALLVLTCLCFVVWVAIGYTRAPLGQGLFVGLLALDLLVFASDFHPRASLTGLASAHALPAGLAPGERVLLHDASELPDFEPNQLLPAGVASVQGYSSLPSQRHVELDDATRADPRLLDLWSAPFILEPVNPTDAREVDGVRFRAEHAIAAGYGGAAAGDFIVPAAIGPVTGIRIVGTLSYAFQAAQGAVVATISVDGRPDLALRAGIDLSERAYDRRSLAGLVQHRKATVALDFAETTPQGEDYIAHLYRTDLVLAHAAGAPWTLSITPTDPRVLVEIEGLALIDAAGVAHSLDLSNRVGFTRLSNQVIQNGRALPRAFVLPRAQAFSPARHAELTATQLVGSPDTDLHTMLLVENDPQTPSQPNGTRPVVAATAVEDVGLNVVRVTAAADVPSYLVLDDFYQRGWTARVDGQPTKLFTANALFRAVAIEPGAHIIEFRFEPLSLLVGEAVSAGSLVIVLALIGWGLRPGRRAVAGASPD